MSREDIEKLLGGYATDTLSEGERRALFAAALEDQELFDVLAKEQALQEVLAEPGARQQLMAALGPEREPFGVRAWNWLRRPAVLAMAGGLATLLVVAGLVLRPVPVAQREVLVAKTIAPPRAQSGPESVSIAAPKVLQAPLPVRKPQQTVTLPEPPALRDTNATLARADLPAAAPVPPPPPRSAIGGMIADAAGQPAGAAAEAVMKRALAAEPRRAKALAASLAGATYRLMLRGADGAYAAVPAETVFHAGDSVRVHVEAKEPGVIFLYQQDAAGEWKLVESVHAVKGQGYGLPSTGGIEPGVAGKVELRLVVSGGDFRISLEFR